MLLAIDQNKLDEQLAITIPAYTVTPCNLIVETAVPVEHLTTNVYSTVAGLPADVERSRARLLALRQRIIESGVKPLSADDLDRYIDETRGR